MEVQNYWLTFSIHTENATVDAEISFSHVSDNCVLSSTVTNNSFIEERALNVP
jgi:hypothetical protein